MGAQSLRGALQALLGALSSYLGALGVLAHKSACPWQQRSGQPLLCLQVHREPCSGLGPSRQVPTALGRRREQSCEHFLGEETFASRFLHQKKSKFALSPLLGA